MIEQEIRRLCSPMVPDPQAFGALAAAMRRRDVAKGELLVQQGKRSGDLIFVEAGIARYFCQTPTGEVTGQFFDEGRFVGDVQALHSDLPATQSIDVVEAGTVVMLSRNALNAAFDSDHALERFGRMLMTESMVGSQRRSANLLQLSPEELYTALFKMLSRDIQDEIGATIRMRT